MRLIILGMGGHARSLVGCLDRSMDIVMTENDDDIPPPTPNDGICAGICVMIGVGDIKTRKRLFERFSKDRFIHGAIHKSAIVHEVTYNGTGVQIMAGAIIQPGVSIGDNTIINTRASIDHDCNIGRHCHIAPGAVLCGGVTLGDECFIGAGSIIVEGVTLAAGTFVKAGSLVVKQNDIRHPSRVV